MFTKYEMRKNNSETEEFFGDDSIIINKPGIYESAIIYDGYNIDIFLSSNYEDLYLIHRGYNQIQLPQCVDIKFETNMKENKYKVLRKYILSLNLYKRNETSLVFCERAFPAFGTTFIVLLKEFQIDYKTFDSGRCYMFSRDEDNKPIIPSRSSLHVYFAFEKERFMDAWNFVELGDLGYNSISKTFSYPLIEKKNHLPNISVLGPTITALSPPLYGIKRTAISESVGSTGSLGSLGSLGSFDDLLEAQCEEEYHELLSNLSELETRDKPMSLFESDAKSAKPLKGSSKEKSKNKNLIEIKNQQSAEPKLPPSIIKRSVDDSVKEEAQGEHPKFYSPYDAAYYEQNTPDSHPQSFFSKNRSDQQVNKNKPTFNTSVSQSLSSKSQSEQQRKPIFPKKPIYE